MFLSVPACLPDPLSLCTLPSTRKQTYWQGRIEDRGLVCKHSWPIGRIGVSMYAEYLHTAAFLTGITYFRFRCWTLFLFLLFLLFLSSAVKIDRGISTSPVVSRCDGRVVDFEVSWISISWLLGRPWLLLLLYLPTYFYNVVECIWSEAYTQARLIAFEKEVANQVMRINSVFPHSMYDRETANTSEDYEMPLQCVGLHRTGCLLASLSCYWPDRAPIAG